MNLYLLSYFNWDDSENIILYHEKDYSDKEFRMFCEEAYECDSVEYLSDIGEYLVEHFHFKYPNVKQYYANEDKIRIIEKGYI